MADRERLNHTLRLALAMRGGVSLAVWIGGAVAEIDVLRRAAPAKKDGLSWATFPQYQSRLPTTPLSDSG